MNSIYIFVRIIRSVSAETIRQDIGLEHLLIYTLKPIIEKRIEEMGNVLFHVLKRDFSLFKQMDAFRRIVVMEAGDFGQSFYTYLFELVRLIVFS